jgi:two-component system, chemotaxis family, sensor kinase CheA
MDADKIKAAFLEKFRQVAGERLARLAEQLEGLRKAPENAALATDLARELHTLKGESRMMGFGEAGRLLHALEDAFKHHRELDFKELASLGELYQEALDAIDAIILKGVEPAVASLISKLRAHVEDGGAHPDASAPEPPAKPSAPPAAAPAPQPQRSDATRIQAAFLEKFRQVAGERLGRLSEQFGRLVSAPDDEALATDLVRELHTLKGESRMMGFAEVGRLLHALEDGLKAHKKKALRELKALEELFQESLDTASAAILRGAADGPADLVARLVAHAVSQGGTSTLPAAGGAAPAQPAAPAPGAAAPAGSGAATPAAAPTKAGVVNAAGQGGYKLSNVVRVNARSLDRLSDLVGDLFSSFLRVNELSRVMEGVWNEARGALLGHGDTLEELSAEQAQELLRSLGGFRRQYQERTSVMASVLDQLLDQVSEIRLLPVADLFGLYRAAARDIARQLGRRVSVQLEGESTPVDRSILDAMGDILLHLVRNAIDHGIESPEERAAAGKPATGVLVMRARTVNDRIQIDVEDDGHGIDPVRVRQIAQARGLITRMVAEKMTEQEAIELIFLPGFTTAATTSDISGRGVGMDVVRTKVQDLGGVVRVDSRPGRGTCFTLELPTSIAIARVLLFRAASQTFAILSTFVQRVDRISVEALIETPAGQAMVIDGRTVLAVDAAELLRLKRKEPLPTRLPTVVVEHSGRSLALLVDELIGERELTIKPFSPFLSGIRTVSGAASLEDGTLILVLHAGELTSAGSRLRKGAFQPVKAVERKAHRVLLVEDSLITRELERSVLASFGLRVDEAGDGLDAWERMSAGEYDLVISDVEMPHMDGLELTRRLKADPRFAHIPVLIVTTLGSDQDRRRGLEAGADGYVVKSEFGSQTFIELVKRFLP